MSLIASATIKPNKSSLKAIPQALPEKHGIEVPNKKWDCEKHIG
jgi:hypothetical protein